MTPQAEYTARHAEILPNMISVQKQLGEFTSMYLLRCLASVMSIL